MTATNQTLVQNASSKQRHISIVTETYPPDLNGVALTQTRWVEGLRLRGYFVSVLRPRPSFDSASAPFHPALNFNPWRRPASLRHTWDASRNDDLALRGPLHPVVADNIAILKNIS